MSRPVFLKAFFEQFGKFIEEMSEMYPDDADFPSFATFLNGLQKTNPMLVISIFNENVSKFSKQIEDRDEDFFLNYSYVEYGSGITDVVGKLAGYFSAMSPETKTCVWDYLRVLKELSKRASSS